MRVRNAKALRNSLVRYGPVAGTAIASECSTFGFCCFQDTEAARILLRAIHNQKFLCHGNLTCIVVSEDFQKNVLEALHEQPEEFDPELMEEIACCGFATPVTPAFVPHQTSIRSFDEESMCSPSVHKPTLSMKDTDSLVNLISPDLATHSNWKTGTRIEKG
jgi:hypothetical protein